MKVKIKVMQKQNFIDIVLPLLGATIIFLNLFPIALSIPVLGDGCHHTLIMKEIVQKGLFGVTSKVSYPLFYHLIGAWIYRVFGIVGVKLISPVSFSLSGVVVYFIALRLTKNRIVAFLSILFIAFSPKIIWYGAQIYMEPFMTLFILLAAYGAILLIERQDFKTAIITGILVGLAIITKQQALFLLIAVPLSLLVARIEFKKNLIVICFALLIALGPHAYMYSSTKSLIQPPPNSVLLQLSKNMLSTKNKILFGGAYELIPAWSIRLEEESKGFTLYQRGVQRHEARHIRIRDMLSIEKLVYLNSLYPFNWYGYTSNETALVLLKVLFLVGLALSFNFALKDKKWLFLILTLIISWKFMDLGSDTKRYFVYLPILLAFVYPLALVFISKTNKGTGKSFLNSLIIFLFVVLLVPGITIKAFTVRNATNRLATLQCYSPSKGGIASVREVGRWIEKHSEISDKIYGTSGYEWRYYSNRGISFDYRIYFLSKERVGYWLRFWNTKYVMVRKNQILPDDKWNHLEYYPESFVSKIEEMYPMVYISSFGDIKVYEVK